MNIDRGSEHFGDLFYPYIFFSLSLSKGGGVGVGRTGGGGGWVGGTGGEGGGGRSMMLIRHGENVYL